MREWVPAEAILERDEDEGPYPCRQAGCLRDFPWAEDRDRHERDHEEGGIPAMAECLTPGCTREARHRGRHSGQAGKVTPIARIEGPSGGSANGGNEPPAPTPRPHSNGLVTIQLTRFELQAMIDAAGNVSLEDYSYLEKAGDDDLELIAARSSLLLKLRRAAN